MKHGCLQFTARIRRKYQIVPRGSKEGEERNRSGRDHCVSIDHSRGLVKTVIIFSS